MNLQKLSLILALVVAPLGAQGPALLPMRTRLLFTFGNDDESQPSHIRRVAALLVVPDGRIYAVDVVEHAVKVFDSTGHFLRKFGKVGELGLISRIWPDARGITVQDYAGAGAFRWVTYSLDGVRVASRSISPAVYNATTRDVRGPTTLFAPPTQELQNTDQSKRTYRYVIAQRANPKRADTLVRIPTDEGWVLERGRGRAVRTPFGEGGAWALLGDSVLAHVDGYSGIVQWIRFSESGFEVSRADSMRRQVLPVTDADLSAVAAANANAQQIRSSSNARGVAPQPAASGNSSVLVNAPKYWSMATTAVFGLDGSLWVGAPSSHATAQQLGTNLWTIFPADGSQPLSAALPLRFRLVTVRGNKAYGTMVDGDNSYGVAYEILPPSEQR
jgi:hypothetical protein